MMNIRKFIETAHNSGGGSYNLNTGEFNSKEGYMVSLEGHEEKHSEWDADNLLKYISSKAEYLAEPDNFLGVWYNEKANEWCFDVSQNVAHRIEAVELGLSRRQQAIWDCAKADEIDLSVAQG
tara:strand:- start:7155 stop:7523 length:369 start_codon:yes stop_codon:yes gene_type:complete